MNYRVLELKDLPIYRHDIKKCYDCNRLIFDMQYPCTIESVDDYCNYVAGFINRPDCIVFGIFDDSNKYLYGIIIYENIRTADSTTAQCHIALDKAIYGKVSRYIFKQLQRYGIADTLYCIIPQIATKAIALVKRLGFRKTGYIPKASAYKNKLGELKLYDENIFVFERTDATFIYNEPDEGYVQDKDLYQR